jgi:hypothetical protein
LEAAASLSEETGDDGAALLLLSSLMGAVIMARATGDDRLRRDLLDRLCQQAGSG